MVAREDVLAILDTVMDPEVPVLSVRELGIVRDVAVEPSGAVTVTVTPTYSGCPAIQVIEDDIVAALHAAGVADVSVVTAYAPAWSSDWIPEAARAKLKRYGIAPPSRSEAGGELDLVASSCSCCARDLLFSVRTVIRTRQRHDRNSDRRRARPCAGVGGAGSRSSCSRLSESIDTA